MYKILLFHAEKALFHEKKHFFCVFLLVLMLIRNFRVDVDIYRKTVNCMKGLGRGEKGAVKYGD